MNRPPDHLPEPHTIPLPGKVDHATFVGVPGFLGITERDGQWSVDLDGPPTPDVVREIERRVKTHKPQ